MVARIVILALYLLASGNAAGADAPSAPEVMAAMIYNFALFVEWPSDAETKQSPFIIGVFGEDPVEKYLDVAMKTRTLQKRRIEVRQISQTGDVKDCHVLFISQSQKKRIPEILAAIKSQAVLTVADIDNFAILGGMIGFIKDGNRLRFQINPDAPTEAGLKISSRLLSLAIPAK
jgi:hypothetical protein